MASGTVKWFNETKGFGFTLRTAAAQICSRTSPKFRVRASRPWRTARRSRLRWSKARRVCKPRRSSRN